MSDDQSSKTTSDESSPAKQQRPQTLFPETAFWMLLTISVVGFFAARYFKDDPSIGRVVGLIGLLVCSFNLFVWFYFRSAYSKSVRRLGACGLLGLVAAFFGLVRVESFSGSLIPTFRMAWEEVHDATLGELKTTAIGGVDLASASMTDFPQFLGPQRNGIVTDANLSTDWQQVPPKEMWRREVGAGWSGFAAVNGFAVTMEQRGPQELVTCYNVDTGEPQWSASLAARHESALGFIGPRSTPTIHNGRVYVQGATGILRCLNGVDGEEVWQRDFTSEMELSQAESEKMLPWGHANSPLVAGDKLIVAVGGSPTGKCVNVAALDLETGETVWEGGSQQISYSSPMVATMSGVEQVVVVNESSVSGHNLETGEQLWEHTWVGHSNTDANCSQPVIVDDQHILVSKGYGMGASLLNLAVEESGEFTVTPVWANRKVLKTKFSNVSIVGDYAYALDDGVLTCVEVKTGERQWKKGRYRFGQLLAADNVLLVLSEFGELSLVEASPAGHKVLGKIEALDGQTWNTLCLTGNKLLIRNAKEAVCYELAQ